MEVREVDTGISEEHVHSILTSILDIKAECSFETLITTWVLRPRKTQYETAHNYSEGFWNIWMENCFAGRLLTK
jgi:hypothetical protein